MKRNVSTYWLFESGLFIYIQNHFFVGLIFRVLFVAGKQERLVVDGLSFFLSFFGHLEQVFFTCVMDSVFPHLPHFPPTYQPEARQCQWPTTNPMFI